MQVKNFRHENVRPDGTFEHEAGAVVTTGRISTSHPKGGCGAGRCNCSPGHWLSVVKPRTENGIVEGYYIQFDSRKELETYVNEHIDYLNP